MKKIKKHIFFTTILLLITVFVVGVLLGESLAGSKANNIDTFVKTLELNTESFLLEQELIESVRDNCDLAKTRISSLSKELYGLGLTLNDEDAQKRLSKNDYRYLKNKFHLMQIKTYLLFYSIKQSCRKADHVILYYYGMDDEGSKEQGNILDEIVKNNENVNIFAIEYNYSDELKFLESYYDITQTPSIVVDFENVHQGLALYGTIKEEIAYS